MRQFNVLTNEIKAAMLFASTDESRYVLNGVLFQALAGKQPILISTDGRRLAVIETDAEQPASDGESVEVVIASSFLKPLCAFAKSQALIVSIEPHPPKRCVFNMFGAHCVVDSEEGALIEGQYPNWKQVVPAGEKNPVSQMALNSDYIGDYSKAGKLLGLDFTLVALNIFNASGAMEVRLGGKPNFYGVVVPCMVDHPKDFKPEFLGL